MISLNTLRESGRLLIVSAGLCLIAPQIPAADLKPALPPARAPFFERLRGLDLKPEQRDGIRPILEALREESRELSEQLRTARRELNQAVMGDETNEQAIRDKAAAVGKLEGDLAVKNARAFARVKALLTAEQIEKLRQPPGRGEPRPSGERPRPIRPRDPAPGTP